MRWQASRSGGKQTIAKARKGRNRETVGGDSKVAESEWPACVGGADRILSRPLTPSLSPEIHPAISDVLRGGEGAKQV